ncbi:acetyltransferase [Paenibacillus sp. CAA11]|uniref:acetyltransferase n=1 Tax=Paenibacillus sp. CAA11 TaxID=1532905 RepID=UPI000D38B07D|nr:acetyltransferase [Paenibacillus sp. CAA11]AWB44520.1 acetyltransferase [Paenibacillus sp. CAA11]
MQIRPYQPEDHLQLVQIWREAVQKTHHFLSKEDFNHYEQIVSAYAFTSCDIWVAQGELGQPVGFIGLSHDKVEMLFVDPKYHGQGIGRNLLNHAYSLCGAGLKVDVNEQNSPAHQFYKKYGFVDIGRSALDESGRPYPLIHMMLQQE